MDHHRGRPPPPPPPPPRPNYLRKGKGPPLPSASDDYYQHPGNFPEVQEARAQRLRTGYYGFPSDEPDPPVPPTPRGGRPPVPRTSVPPTSKPERQNPSPAPIKHKSEQPTDLMAANLAGATPSGAWSFRPPSPPHIHVPQAPDDKKFVLPAFTGLSGTEQERRALAIITQGSHVAVVKRDWQYEWRRKAQPVLAFLHLGTSAAARDVEYLKRDGITMLLVIRDTTMATARMLSGDKVARQLGIESAAIDVSGYQELIANLPRAIKTINDHLISEYLKYSPNQTDSGRTTWGKVLVFCESGNERSALVVAAYIMYTYGLDLVTAIQYVQNQRFCVAFDDPLKRLLLSYQDILEAHRASNQFHPNENINVLSQPKEKRSRSDADSDELMGMEDADDAARFADRSFVPYHERDPDAMI
ncbi:Serine/threonine/tyrosine-interacting protein B [Lachnellula suecica]|uniref:Serine/threonine/tyrosine-interacting protein B n=1 Tax=Lachnellula suecica TaxID=602035 RepID=A0A8T9C7U1_9HELO|nr:Serine/threonine/tyrosine-interacting protein B [Lachnellula suecica]